MKNFLATIQTQAITYNQAVEQFGAKTVESAYNKGRISFEGEFIAFVQ